MFRKHSSMKRTQHQRESLDDYFPPRMQEAPLLDRIRHSAQALSAHAGEAGQEPFRTMHSIAIDLEEVTTPLLRAVDHCNQFLAQPGTEYDVALLRDATHLSARIEAMVSQLENTVHTMERLAERTAETTQAPVVEAPRMLVETTDKGLTGDGGSEWAEPVPRPSLRRTLRGLAPAVEI